MKANIIVASVAAAVIGILMAYLLHVKNQLLECKESNMQLNTAILSQNLKIKAYENRSSKSELEKREQKVITKYKYIKLKDDSCNSVVESYLKLMKE